MDDGGSMLSYTDYPEILDSNKNYTLEYIDGMIKYHVNNGKNVNR